MAKFLTSGGQKRPKMAKIGQILRNLNGSCKFWATFEQWNFSNRPIILVLYLVTLTHFLEFHQKKIPKRKNFIKRVGSGITIFSLMQSLGAKNSIWSLLRAKKLKKSGFGETTVEPPRWPRNRPILIPMQRLRFFLTFELDKSSKMDVLNLPERLEITQFGQIFDFGRPKKAKNGQNWLNPSKSKWIM